MNMSFSAQHFIDDIEAKIVKENFKPIFGGFYADPCVIKQRKVGYYSYLQDIGGGMIASSFNIPLLEVEADVVHHKEMLKTIIDYIRKITNDNIEVRGWKDSVSQPWMPTIPGLDTFFYSLL